MKDIVTLIIPKDKSILENKYTEVLVEVVAELLTKEELKYLILRLGNQGKDMR